MRSLIEDMSQYVEQRDKFTFTNDSIDIPEQMSDKDIDKVLNEKVCAK